MLFRSFKDDDIVAQHLAVTAAGLPFADQPERIALAQGRAEAGNLRVEHPLQPCPDVAGALLMLRSDLTQGAGGFGRQLVAGKPERSLRRGRRGSGPRVLTSPRRAAGRLSSPWNHSTCWCAVAKSLWLACRSRSLPGSGIGNDDRSSPMSTS